MGKIGQNLTISKHKNIWKSSINLAMYCTNHYNFCDKRFKYTVLEDIGNFNGIAQDCSNSGANALELLQSCAKPSIQSCELNPLWTII